MSSLKIQFVTALHGDEQVPFKVLDEQKVEHIVANPLAVQKKQRYIDMDMNKAFGLQGNSYEEKQARCLLETLNASKPEYVIDFHTTSAITEPFAIIVDPHMLPVAKTLGVNHVVFMKHNIKNGNALINHYPGVSVEAGTHDTETASSNVAQIAKSALHRREHRVELYEVYDVITDPGEYINFQEHSDGFIPVLAGERAYDFYGLKAKRIGKWGEPIVYMAHPT